MNFRDKLEKQKDKRDQNQKGLDEFINGEGNPPAAKKHKKELAKPVTISMTPSVEAAFDKQIKRFHMLAFQKDYNTKLNRGTLVRMLTKQLEGLSDEELFELISRFEESEK